MPRWWSSRLLVLLTCGFLLGALLVVGSFAQVGSIEERTDAVSWVNGFWLGRERLAGMFRSSATGITVGGTNVASVAVTRGALTTTFGALGLQPAVPATEVIAAAATITANACGSIKNISSASAVTTGTTDTLTDPVTTGVCVMWLCNVNASDAITLDKNAKILLVSGGNVALAASSCMAVGSDGAIWKQLSAQLAAT